MSLCFFPPVRDLLAGRNLIERAAVDIKENVQEKQLLNE